MSAFRSLLLAAAVLCALVPVDPARAGGMAAQRIVARKAVEALPVALQSFFVPRLDGVLERAVEPDGAWRRTQRFRSRREWHYLTLDAAAEDSTYEQRMRAALAFPSKRSAARRLFREHDIKRGGQLVWKLEDLAQQLRHAFERGDKDEIVRAAGYVIHFSADAANPFCATRNRRGEETGNMIFGRWEMGDPLFAHQDVAQRIGWELVRRNAERYRDAIDAGSLRFEVDVQVPQVILEAMVASLDSLEVLCRADAEIIEKIGASDGETFRARADEYYQLLDGRCGEHVVENLRTGSRLAATLIVGAWQRAGSPDPSRVPAMAAAQGAEPGPSRRDQRATPDQPDQPSQPEAAAPIEYVASKNSKVFHRFDCAHARRISPANLVRFADGQEAADAGKRPCRVCHPDKD